MSFSRRPPTLSYLVLITAFVFLLTDSEAFTHSIYLHSNKHIIPTQASIYVHDLQTCRSMILLGDEYEYSALEVSPWLVVGVALTLGIAAQTFINTMLKGDQGLGAYLKDGSGYNRSGFRGKKSTEDEKEDPLPWLKLPKLSFVEVAGQVDEDLDYKTLERIRVEMNERLEEGKVEEASILREELEILMKDAGIEYKSEER